LTAVADYLRDPEAIYRESFARVREASDLSRVPAELGDLVVRLVHACGMPDIVPDLCWLGDPVRGATRALACGAPVICDCEMVQRGVISERLPRENPVMCTLCDPRVVPLSLRQGTTRSAAAVELWRPMLKDAVVAVGNAPTALFRLLELLAAGAERPAAIFAFPVGFVGAAESKDALVTAGLDIPFVTLLGRRGGSALAAAAVNALGGSTGG
jgi:precorrin isomerase